MDAATAHATDRPDHRAEPAIRDIPSHLCFWIIGGAALVLDLWSKEWVFSELRPSEIRTAVPGIIDFTASLNAGAVFGSFTGHTEVFILASLFALGFVFYLFAHSGRGQRALHVALALVLAGALGNLYDRAFIIADLVQYEDASGKEVAYIGRMLSDPEAPIIRIGDYPDGANPRSFARSDVEVRKLGVVRDFIKFVPKFPAWVPRLAGREIWPWVFNVADAALVCGVVLLLLHTWLDRQPRGRRRTRHGR
ncbi:MAG: signal peptidase II [Phycisphaerales bacterium]|nr:MAG: signal peptidase II [Phycisphaerales bacterium]